MSDGLPRDYDTWRTACEPNSFTKMRYLFLCEDCDNPVYEEEGYYEIDGFNYCNRCIAKYVKSTDKDELCEYCEETIPYDSLAYKIHGCWICEHCMDENKIKGRERGF